MKRFSTVIIVLSSCSLFFCCSSRNQADKGGGGPGGGSGLSVTTIYPHPQGWQDARVHGASVIVQGTDACLKCHKKKSDQFEKTPTCASCHELVPHEDNWGQGDGHGVYVVNKGKEKCKTLCHGTDFKGGLSQVSCSSVLCHAVYPHTPDWPQATIHGEQAKRHLDRCAGCHGALGERVLNGKNCYTCHSKYPHIAPSGLAPADHGAFVLANSTRDCTPCHGNNLDGGISGVVCADCHGVYPHPSIPWSTHGEMAMRLGNSACQRCHGTNYDRRLNGRQACIDCHLDYPHPSRDWINDPDRGRSGRFIPNRNWHGGRVNYHRSTTNCQLCHRTDLSRVFAGNSCISCHGSYPILHRQIAPLLLWKGPGPSDPGGHGAYFRASAANADECRICHGGDYRGGIRTGNKSCYVCHSSFPHPSDWYVPGNSTQVHGEYVRNDLSGNPTSCGGSCHGTDFQSGPAISCMSANCHPDYPHVQPDWNTGLVHGATFSGRYNSASTGVTCWNCHKAPVFFDNTQPDNQYLNTASDCYSCHVYPHLGYNSRPWIDTSHWAHMLFMYGNPPSLLFVDANGNNARRPGTPGATAQTATWQDAVTHTCGRNANGTNPGGLCHFNPPANRRPTNPNPASPCSYCHL